MEYPWKHHGSLHSRVLEVDPVLGKTTTYWYDDNTREQFVTDDWHGQPIRQLIESNRAQYAATDENARMTPLRDGGEMQWTRVASLPLAIAMDVLKKTANGKDRAAVSRWLTDPENRHFLTRPIKRGV